MQVYGLTSHALTPCDYWAWCILTPRKIKIPHACVWHTPPVRLLSAPGITAATEAGAKAAATGLGQGSDLSQGRFVDSSAGDQGWILEGQGGRWGVTKYHAPAPPWRRNKPWKVVKCVELRSHRGRQGVNHSRRLIGNWSLRRAAVLCHAKENKTSKAGAELRIHRAWAKGLQGSQHKKSGSAQSTK